MRFVHSIWLVLTLLLAPFGAALGVACHCPVDTVLQGSGSSLGQPACCTQPHQCCYRNGDGEGAWQLLADLLPQSRAELPAPAAGQLLALEVPSAPRTAAMVQSHPRAPPMPARQLRCQLQTWLI